MIHSVSHAVRQPAVSVHRLQYAMRPWCSGRLRSSPHLLVTRTMSCYLGRRSLVSALSVSTDGWSRRISGFGRHFYSPTPGLTLRNAERLRLVNVEDGHLDNLDDALPKLLIPHGVDCS